MRLIFFPLVLVALAGCGERADAPDSEPGNDGQPAPAAAPATTDVAWEGRFAATPELCEGGVWDIRETGIVTEGETACEVEHVARAAAQVTLELACTAEGMPSRERWTLTERGAGMNVRRAVEGAETSDVDLVRC